MAIVRHLEWTATGLDVAYRASPEPQKVTIRATIEKAEPKGSRLPRRIANLVGTMNVGAASGIEFDPAASSAKLLTGIRNKTDKGAEGPDFEWEMEVQAVSPYFIRELVETFGGANHGKKVSIVGSIPLDGSALSVTPAIVCRWIEDVTSYPGEWPSPGFAITQEVVPRGAHIAVTFKNDLADDVSEKLEQAISYASFPQLHFPNMAGTASGVTSVAPSLGRKKREWIAKYDESDHAVTPLRAAWVNTLAAFHKKVSPIESVRLGFSA